MAHDGREMFFDETNIKYPVFFSLSLSQETFEMLTKQFTHRTRYVRNKLFTFFIENVFMKINWLT